MRFLKPIYVLTALLILIQLVPLHAFAALSQQDSDAIYGDHAYYQDDTTTCAGSSGSTTTGTGLDYSGQPIFTQEQTQAITDNQPFYESSAQKVDIPWQMIAVIHSNESGLKRANPADGQGVYQFYDKHGGPYPTGPVSDEEFQRQTDLAAQLIKSENGSLTSQSDPAVIKDAFFGYNGRAAGYVRQAVALGFPPDQGYEGSPYVMNKADAQRDPAVNKTTWGQVKTDNGPLVYPTNNFYGAFVSFAALAGVSGGSCGNNVNGSVRQKVVQLLQQELELWKSGQLKGNDYFKYSQGRSEAWCADFASWIYNQASYPLSERSDGNVPYTGTVWEIGQKNEKFHSHLNPGYIPQPGDLVIYSGNSHTEIVESFDNGIVTSIAGNWGGSVSQHSYNINDPSIYSGHSIFGFVSPD